LFTCLSLFESGPDSEDNGMVGLEISGKAISNGGAAIEWSLKGFRLGLLLYLHEAPWS
jgi:hypothetical protein